MGRLKSIVHRWGGAVASLALVLGVMSTTSACCLWFHQPKVPQVMEKFKK